ncbi:putative OxPP cycle protein opcA [[Synechococcus] sp. NIES-970]|uniref:glucose-6-phosphate dehydrogenase assembly protein OpcA n=1 Tax=Picosynechococcus sp. NKBG15041c TaxID=1407650 RepID=UPI0004638A84|nr:glucose-6-phosphate dehydrogenase assembly protein OpcA [Picosynechococcus sp. NKBG15041c]BAW96750.1 putative OxPP cycle protein opcA [[Synechococcus] sp. NIES-970]
MTISAPLVSLQAPKDVSIEEIEVELTQLWQNYRSDEGMSATRATTFSFLVYEPDDSQALLGSLGFYSGPIDGIAGSRTTAAIRAAQKAYGFEETGKLSPELLQKLREAWACQTQGQGCQPLTYSADLSSAGVADAIASSNPCRIITLCPTTGEDVGVSAQVSAYCPINKRGSSTLICCEYITLSGTAAALERIGGLITALMVRDLPKFIWWKAVPDSNYGLFQRLMAEADTLIVDSSEFLNAEVDLRVLCQLISQGINVADLNWSRLAAWQELTAAAFDPPERRAAIWEVDHVTLNYEKGNATQALMYMGWLMGRLNWDPTAIERESGDYEIHRLRFSDRQNKTITAELVGLPMADVGEVVGDLVSLKLTSSNLAADCCTVLCSETSGCMHMESGGGAQACRIEQVTPLADQKTDHLLGQQLQRWGKDVLYQETMAQVQAILAL